MRLASAADGPAVTEGGENAAIWLSSTRLVGNRSSIADNAQAFAAIQLAIHDNHPVIVETASQNFGDERVIVVGEPFILDNERLIVGSPRLT